MAEPTATKKKLPFKPTALRNAAPKPKTTPTPTSINDDDDNLLQASAAATTAGGDDNENDTLALFRRAREMAPIVEADRERRMRRQLQKQRELEDERRRPSAGSKHALVKDEGEREEGDAAMPSPTGTQGDVKMEDGIMATQEEDNRELVTPPPSKRSRRDDSESSTRHRNVELDSNTVESLPDSPTMRAMRSLAPDRSVTPAVLATANYTAAAASSYNTRARARAGPPPGSQVVILDSDDEDDVVALGEPPAPAVPEIVEDALTLDLDLNADAPEDDDEFAEYVRRAQEQRDKLLAEQNHDNMPSSAGPAHTQSSSNDLAPLPSAPIPSGLSSPVRAAPPQPQQKQIIDIVITSDVPGTRMCLVKFRFDRPLRVVRDSWTALQHRHNVPLRGLLDRDEDVVLTWRRKKVYMVSTLLSLGIRPAEDGSGAAVLVDGHHSRDGFNESRTRVHMQAWTPALFAQMEREEETRRKREAGELDEEEGTQTQGTQGTDGSAGGGADAGEEEGANKLRIILKSKDMEPVKLKVMPETTTETLVAAFRAQRGVADDVDVGLWFDGMRLEDGATMADADIDDMDTIEVHVK